jgi:hypothetical protein
MSAVGNWTLHFSWGCTGGYSTSPMTFNANGTFSLAPYTGKFVENDGKIVFKFDSSNTVYGGDIVSNDMLGISTTFGGLNGCWYALRVGTTALEVDAKTHTDAAGNKPK